MAIVNTKGISFLYRFSLGQENVNFPGINVISVSSTAPGDHDKKNLFTTSLRETWRSNTILTTQTIIMEANDLATTIDTFAILNHNLSSLATVTLQVANDLAFLTPGFTISIPYNKTNLLLTQDFGATYRYFKLRITDPTNVCGFIEIGKIIAGKAFTFTNNEDIVDKFSVSNDDLAYKMKTEGFFRASNERVKVRKLNVRFQSLDTIVDNLANRTDINYQNFKEFLDYCGETLPYLVLVDPTEPYFQLLWGQTEAMPTFSYDVNRYADSNLIVQEVY